MFRPSDIQLILLSTAAQRADGSLLPPPESIGGQAVRILRSIPPMIKKALVSEAAISDAALAWRGDGEAHYGAFITDEGRQLISAERPATGPSSVSPPPTAAPTATTTKTAMVLDLLRRPAGATLDELVTATGWLPHTTRAALSGLRKKRHTIAKSKRDGTTCYKIEQAA